jgi:hypothetical protein
MVRFPTRSVESLTACEALNNSDHTRRLETENMLETVGDIVTLSAPIVPGSAVRRDGLERKKK